MSRISPGAPLRLTGTNLGLRVRLVDVINYAKFHLNRLRDLDSVRGRILTIPIGLPVNTCELLFTLILLLLLLLLLAL